jgi:hypothetical protein
MSDILVDYYHPKDFNLVEALTGNSVKTFGGKRVISIHPHGLHLSVVIEGSYRARQYGCNGRPVYSEYDENDRLITPNFVLDIKKDA